MWQWNLELCLCLPVNKAVGRKVMLLRKNKLLYSLIQINTFSDKEQDRKS